MQDFHIQTTVGENGTITIKDIPLAAGEAVEITVAQAHSNSKMLDEKPLFGTVLAYIDPFEGVAMNEWEAAK